MTSTAGRILGNYQLGEPIGRGGASEVFAGVHRFLGHEVAVKLLRADLPGGEPASSVDAFLGEAARARAVHHPNLVSVLDFGRDDATGRCYLVMERIPGESLAERLRRVGRLPEPDVRALAGALADAMQAAHDGGIVHRDLKPANVMLRGDQPTVVDFGLARDLGGQSALETGRRVGTPAYMAPEQLTGGLIAPCVDIWALGVILFETLTGKLPFEGFADGRCPQLFESAPRVATLVHVTPDLDALVATCLERSPGRRPSTMAVIARALRGEGEERVTQDVAAPVLSGRLPGTSAAPPIAGAPGDPAARIGDPAGRVGDTAARLGDTAARDGDRGASVGDPGGHPGDARVDGTSARARVSSTGASRPRRDPARPATGIGPFALRPRQWSIVALAAAAASLAAFVTVRVVGGASSPARAPAPIGAVDQAGAVANEDVARPSRRHPGIPSPSRAMEQGIAESRASTRRSDGSREAPGAGGESSAAGADATSPGAGGESSAAGADATSPSAAVIASSAAVIPPSAAVIPPSSAVIPPSSAVTPPSAAATPSGAAATPPSAAGTPPSAAAAPNAVTPPSAAATPSGAAPTPSSAAAPSSAAGTPSGAPPTPSSAAAPSSAAVTRLGPVPPSRAPTSSLAIDIRSTPSGADVVIAGKRRGRTPLHLELPGPRRVRLSKRGYRPAAIRVERAGLVDVHLTRRGRRRPASERAAKQADRPSGEGLD